MKTGKRQRLFSVIALATLLATVVTGCSNNQTTVADAEQETAQVYRVGGASDVTPEEATAEDLLGVYNQSYDYTELTDKVTTSTTTFAEGDLWWEENRLILHANEDIDRGLTKGNMDYPDGHENIYRYVLIKEMFVANRGSVYYSAYYGTFTNDGTTVTLNTPDWGTYYTYQGDGLPGGWTKPEKGEIISDGSVLNGFDEFYYNSNAGSDPQTVTVNLEDGTFDFESSFNFG
jgi:hypothetical protein